VHGCSEIGAEVGAGLAMTARECFERRESIERIMLLILAELEVDFEATVVPGVDGNSRHHRLAALQRYELGLLATSHRNLNQSIHFL